MLHPSYSDLINVVNSEVEPGDTPIINSRYSIVIAAAKRARQIIGGAEPELIEPGKKPLSMAVEELYQGEVKILSEAEGTEEEDN
ncbi:MAG: DNA-directed RNA polymerase subunit omega [Lacrimispora sp.]|uniref:DNA-directed RNA polymerase subunit omega n=1 Tax=Lacrimispora sp. TaxID=2719234 RepID=UPI0039E70929